MRVEILSAQVHSNWHLQVPALGAAAEVQGVRSTPTKKREARMSTASLGLQLISERLADFGVQSLPVTGNRSALIIHGTPGRSPVSVSVFTRSGPSPAGGKAGANSRLPGTCLLSARRTTSRL